jgi:phosphate starvation-inducible PhoH-like protein
MPKNRRRERFHAKKEEKVQGLTPLHRAEDRPVPPIKAQRLDRTKVQKNYGAVIQANQLTACRGPAGTGKTAIAVEEIAELYLAKDIEKIILTRPALEAGDEELGFRPGDIDEKYAAYVRPLREHFERAMGQGFFEYLVESKKVEGIPLADMRGLTFNAGVIMTEAQNATPKQMKLFLTRIGEKAKVIVEGDTSQRDDLKREDGLSDMIRRMKGCPGFATFQFTVDDVMRSGLAREVILRYDDYHNDASNDDSEGPRPWEKWTA